MADPISVVVARGAVVESRHRVHAVAVADGRVVDAAGDPDLATSMRSAAKPFQALPLVGVAPELPAQEVAIACASHEATDEQLAAVRTLLARSGAGEDDLECGEEGGSRLRHNCSGKHAGMLLLAERRGWPHSGYRLADHPVQAEMTRVVADAARLSAAEIPTGVDGCGVVAFGLSLVTMARMFARLAAGEVDGGDPVVAAMRAHPDLVGGPGAVDTALMQAVPGSIAKRGAEGLLCGVLADGTAFAVKVEDGANRAVRAAAGAFLGVSPLRESAVFNSRGEEVGKIFATR